MLALGCSGYVDGAQEADQQKLVPDAGPGLDLKSKPDTGAGKPDTGAGKPDTAGVKPDTGNGMWDTGGPMLDLGPLTTSCSKIYACSTSCTDPSCIQQCINKGTSAGKANYNSLLACYKKETMATCKSQCAGGLSTGCYKCIQLACSAEYTTCFGVVPWPDQGPPDAGSVTLDGGGSKLDTGGATLDGATGGWSCGQISACAAKCTNSTCLASCVSKGSADGQKKFTALRKCTLGAMAGSCKSLCAGGSSPACTKCQQTACSTEYNACSGLTGSAGYGELCGGLVGCKSGLICIQIQGGSTSTGFCTKTCPASSAGDPCTGHSSGQMSFCGLHNTAKTTFYCVFLCKAVGGSWSCPPKLKCGPPSQGQAICGP